VVLIGTPHQDFSLTCLIRSDPSTEMVLERWPNDKLNMWSLSCYYFYFLIDPSQIPLWVFIYGFVPHTTPRNRVNHLSKIKFYGEGETYTFEHIICLCLGFFSQNFTHEGIVCRLLTLTFFYPS